MNWATVNAPGQNPNTNRDIEALDQIGQLSSHYKTFVTHVNKCFSGSLGIALIAQPIRRCSVSRIANPTYCYTLHGHKLRFLEELKAQGKQRIQVRLVSCHSLIQAL
jgi:hypothetical protein